MARKPCHTFGTLAFEAWPLPDVQAYLLGHADIATPSAARAAITIHRVKRAPSPVSQPRLAR
jgi:hypothetical protein